MSNKLLAFRYTSPSPAGDFAGAFEIEATGGFTGNLLHIHQHTGTVGVVQLIDIEFSDTDVIPIRIRDGTPTVMFQVDNSGNLTLNGTVDGVDIAARDHAESHDAVSHSDITTSGADIDDAVTKKHTAGTDPNDHVAGTDPNDHASGSDNQAAGDFAHNSLASLNDGTDYEHITQAQKDELHSDTLDHTQDTDTALGSGAVAADHGTAATDQIINVSYGTGAAPTANTTTIGSLYITHEA